MSAVFALAVVALATTFTSCEKEEFNVKFEPNPAMVCFTPTVIDAATNVNVTAKVEITGAETITSTASDKALPSGKATITATFKDADGKTATGTATVDYPAVAAGQTLSYSPVILLSSVFNIEAGSAVNAGAPTVEYGNATVGHSHAGITWAENASDYLTDYTATWNKTADATKVNAEILVTSVELNAAIKDKMAVKNESTAETEGKFQASAWSLYTAEYTIQPANVVYTFTSIASGDLVAKVTYYNPIYSISVQPKEMPFPGHEGSYEHGHGHGGNPNAGGGISLAD